MRILLSMALDGTSVGDHTEMAWVERRCRDSVVWRCRAATARSTELRERGLNGHCHRSAGNVGQAMAISSVRAGHSVAISATDPAHAQDAAANAGAKAASSSTTEA